MALRMLLAQGDSMLQSEFVEPAFDIFQNPSSLGALFSGLSKYGLRLNDLRLETAGTLGDFSVLGYLFSFAVSVRIRLDRIEIQCMNLKQVGATTLDHVVVDAFKAVKLARPSLAFKTHVLGLNLHGSLEGVTTLEFLSKYAAAGPDGIGPRIGNGVVFYFGPEGPRLTSSLTLDLSIHVPDGLFLRVHSTWDGQKLEAMELPIGARGYVASVLKSLELESPID